MNLNDIHKTLGELSITIVSLESAIAQGRKSNVKEFDAIKEEMLQIRESVNELKKTAHMGAGAWKAILGVGMILSIVWTSLRIIGKG